MRTNNPPGNDRKVEVSPHLLAPKEAKWIETVNTITIRIDNTKLRSDPRNASVKAFLLLHMDNNMLSHRTDPGNI